MHFSNVSLKTLFITLSFRKLSCIMILNKRLITLCGPPLMSHCDIDQRKNDLTVDKRVSHLLDSGGPFTDDKTCFW